MTVLTEQERRLAVELARRITAVVLGDPKTTGAASDNEER